MSMFFLRLLAGLSLQLGLATECKNCNEEAVLIQRGLRRLDKRGAHTGKGKGGTGRGNIVQKQKEDMSVLETSVAKDCADENAPCANPKVYDLITNESEAPYTLCDPSNSSGTYYFSDVAGMMSISATIKDPTVGVYITICNKNTSADGDDLYPITPITKSGQWMLEDGPQDIDGWWFKDYYREAEDCSGVSLLFYGSGMTETLNVPYVKGYGYKDQRILAPSTVDVYLSCFSYNDE